MDMTQSIAPRSDQINADDLMAGPVTVTVKDVTEGAAEQPFDFHLVEFPGRAYRPSKSMRRVIVMAWGAETAAYAGRRLTLFRNPDITFGREKVGGVEIAAISHIDKPMTLALTKTRGKRAAHTVQPLPTAAPQPTDTSGRDWVAELKLAGDDIDAVASLGKAATTAHAAKEVVAAMSRKWNELNKANEQKAGNE